MSTAMTSWRLSFQPKDLVFTTHVVTPRWDVMRKQQNSFAVTTTINCKRQLSHHAGPTMLPLGPCGRLVLCFHVTDTAHLFHKIVQQRSDKGR